jgi:CRP/FNR family transcriptional regulator
MITLNLEAWLPELSADFKDEVLKKGYLKYLKEGDVLWQEQSSIRIIPFVLKGALKVIRQDDDGRELLLYYIVPGQSCIMAIYSALNPSQSKVKAVADEDTELLSIPVQESTSWIKRFPEWTHFIIHLYQQRFEDLIQVLDTVAFAKLEDRVHDWLQKKSKLLQTKTITVTHQQIAQDTGSSREVISRTLKQLENQGILVMGRNKIILK